MLVLAVDTTALTASAAVVAFENGVPDRYSLITVKNRLTHSENLMPMVEKALSAMKWAVGEMERRYSLMAEEKVKNIPH